jgi:multidrug efflux pump subunit AcrB
LVRLASTDGKRADRTKVVDAIRARLKELPAATVRLRDLSGPNDLLRGAYPIAAAVHGPDADNVRKFAEQIAARLRQSQKLTDVGLGDSFALLPQLNVHIDRQAIASHGVNAKDLFDTLAAHTGSLHVNDFTRFGRTWQIRLAAAKSARADVESLKRLRVRNAKGDMVALSALAKISLEDGTACIERFNSAPMVDLTANPASGVSVAEARALCRKLADDVRKQLNLSAEYRLSWLDGAEGRN